MCRYGDVTYKDHYACFSCRKMFRQPAPHEMAHPTAVGQRHVCPCPQCGAPMADLGLDFQAPRQADVRQWRKVERLYAAGYAFQSCGCGGPGPRPRRLRELGTFLAEQGQARAAWEHRVRLEARAAERAGRRKARAKARVSSPSRKAAQAAV